MIRVTWAIRTSCRTCLTILRKLAWSAGLVSAPAHAAFLSGEALDTAADVISVIVLIVVPVIVIALFWLVHVLPEKIAEKRHHPQKEAIHTLCLLSLVFGGLLWPAAWLWAYSRPVVYKMAHGTELHDDYYLEQLELAENGELDAEGLRRLRDELDALEARGNISPGLRDARRRLQSVEVRIVPPREVGVV